MAIEQLKEQIEDGRETAADLQRQLTKAVSEAATLRQKVEGADEGIRAEDVEDLKRRMGLRLQDSETQLEAALNKAVAAEKAKSRVQTELDAVIEELEKVNLSRPYFKKCQQNFRCDHRFKAVLLLILCI